MAKARGKDHKKRIENTYLSIYLVPVAMVLALAPLVVRYHEYTQMAKVYLYGIEDLATTASDIMSWWKSAIILIAAVLMLVCYFCKAFTTDKNRWKWSVLWIPLGIYGLFAFLSACFSEYSYFSFHGMDGLFESVWVLLAYCMCTIYTFYVVEREEAVRKIVKIYGVGLSILGVYGLVELFFANPLETSLGKWMVYPLSLVMEYGEALDLEMNLERLFLTFYNPNYVGSYMALTLPFTIGIIFALNKKKEKIWFGILGILQVAFLVASEARSGLFALGVAMVVYVVLNRKNILKYWKVVLPAVLVLIGVFLAVDGFNDFTYLKRLTKLSGEANVETTDLEAIETLDDKVTITYGGNTLEIIYAGDAEAPFALTCDGEAVSYSENEQGIWITEDERFTNIQLAVTGDTYFDVGIEGYAWRFVDGKEQGGYYYINADNYPVKISVAEKALPEKYFSFANNRGFIWAKTLPLLKDSIILGSGPDTFYMVYPWNDYVANYRNGNLYEYVNRPHNMYLQMGVQNGMVSLVAFLIFVGMYFVSSFKVYLKCENSFLSNIGKGITAGVAGYLVTGLVNDSMVGIAQVFWVLIGLGLAVNCLVQKQKEGSYENGK